MLSSMVSKLLLWCRYALLHLHPLRSRVMDMDHKLRVAMDNLIRKVRVASSSRPPPGIMLKLTINE